MYDRNKNKIKIDINKALQTVNSVIKPTSQIKEMLEESSKDIQFQRTDKVHDTMTDSQDGREFIISEHSKDPRSNNYRSPYSNRYYPNHKEDMYMLSPLLRDLQEKGNLLFSQYGKLYYGQDGCIPNFYVFETEDGLNFAFYVKKIYKEPECFGLWSSSNLIQIRGDPAKSVSYKVQTTVLYEFNVLNEKTQQLMEVYGSTKKNRVESKRWTPEYEIDEFHLQMTGRLVEEMETFLRQQIQNIFFRKTKDIIFKTRFINTKEEENQRQNLAKQMNKIRAQSTRVID